MTCFAVEIDENPICVTNTVTVNFLTPWFTYEQSGRNGSLSQIYDPKRSSDVMQYSIEDPIVSHGKPRQ